MEKKVERRRKYYRDRARDRRAFLRAVKLKSGCVDCGFNDHPEALEFDHVEPRTHSNRRRSIPSNWSWPRILEELDRVEVRCANCHRARTAERR